MMAEISLHSMFLMVFLVFVAGAAGSVARHLATIMVTRFTGGSAPLATLAVNVTGSFLAGAIGALAAAQYADTELVLIVVVGFLGGFTTFSTWIMQMVVQFENGDYSGAFYNLSGSLITGTIAAVLGFYLIMTLL
ncbi:MAG: CrcB family protein [Balneolaceae bacterium]|jgi:CrcB protein|nr:MAG: CrcB family protein [Balneolaceae bacterium]